MSNVKLVWVTPNVDQILGYIARVSNPENQDNPDVAKLLAYMEREGHVSPFTMSNMCVEVNTTRRIGRQFLRHWSIAPQEFCVTGDTLVTTLTESGNVGKMSIADMYRYQFDNRMKVVWDRGVRVYDEATKTFVRSTVKEVFSTGLKPVFRVELEDGKVLTCTEDHKILSRLGFVPLKDLKVDDYVGVNGLEAYKSKEWLTETKARSMFKDGGIQYIANQAQVSYHTIRKWLRVHGLSFTKKESAVVAGAPWNKGLAAELQPMYGKLHSDATRDKMRDASRKGEASELYTGGAYRDSRQLAWDWQTKYRNRIITEHGGKCAQCASTEDLQIDHIKPISTHPELSMEFSNVQILCNSCHKVKSVAESAAARQTARWKKIKSITPAGEQETFDLEVDHASHNYVANGVITHNSQRYQDVNSLGEFTILECRMQDTKDRQNSLEATDQEVADWFQWAQQTHIDNSKKLYSEALSRGIAKEQACTFLPEGNTPSRLYFNGNFRSWIHYLRSRLHKSTQKEHRLIAGEIAGIFKQVAPITYSAFFPEVSNDQG